jgi:site-specific recombinase
MKNQVFLPGKEDTLTYTVQPIAGSAAQNMEKTGKTEAEETVRLLLSVFDSLNILCERLSRLDYVIKRKIMETSLSKKDKGGFPVIYN